MPGVGRGWAAARGRWPRHSDSRSACERCTAPHGPPLQAAYSRRPLSAPWPPRPPAPAPLSHPLPPAPPLLSPRSPGSQPSSIDTCAELPAGIAASPAPPRPLGGGASSSLRSAGTVSGGEVAQAASAAPSLKRALSSCGEDDGADSFYTTKAARLEGAAGSAPARGARAAAARAPAAWADPPAAAADSGDEATHTLCSDSSDGLEFLLRACEMLDPLAHAEAAAEAAAQRCALLRPPPAACWRCAAGCGLHAAAEPEGAALSSSGHWSSCRAPCWHPTQPCARSCPAPRPPTHPVPLAPQAQPHRFSGHPRPPRRRQRGSQRGGHSQDHSPVPPRRRQPGSEPRSAAAPPRQPPPAGARGRC